MLKVPFLKKQELNSLETSCDNLGGEIKKKYMLILRGIDIQKRPEQEVDRDQG
jgi:hypothetical protein